MFIVTSFNQLPRSNYKLKKYIIKLKIVFQKEIFPGYLKYELFIFNSVAVEADLPWIPRLLEKFLYFNDDMYFTLIIQQVCKKVFKP